MPLRSGGEKRSVLKKKMSRLELCPLQSQGDDEWESPKRARLDPCLPEKGDKGSLQEGHILRCGSENDFSGKP